MGSGYQLKGAADAVPDDGLRVATSCSFDEVGTVSSARGRQKANDADGLGLTPIGGSGDILGGCDGSAVSAKWRFIKRGTAVYTNTLLALDDTTNLTSEYTTSLGTLAAPFKGGSAPTWSSTATLSGFLYKGYAYLADGSAAQRFKLGAGTPPTATAETWGLRSPGYHEITTADQLAINSAVDADLMTVTVAGNHGLGVSAAASAVYDGSAAYIQNVELVGFKAVDNIPDNEINTLHYVGTTGGSDITVVSSAGTLEGSGVYYTITYQNGAGAFNWTTVNFRGSSTGSGGNLTGGGSIVSNTLGSYNDGDDDPATNEVQTISYSGTVSGGNYRLVFARTGTSGLSITEDIAFDATAAEVQAAILKLPIFNSTPQSAGPVTVTSATQFTFPTTTLATGGSNIVGGGIIGFIRQGPTLTRDATNGDLVGGAYYYAYTFYNGVAESNWSAQVPIAATTGDAVILTNVLVGPAGTTERRIYRTDVDGRQLYYIGKIENNTAYTFTDTARLAAGADWSNTPGVQVDYTQNPQGTTDRQSRGSRSPRRGINEAEVTAKANEDKLREKLSTNLGLISDWTDHDPIPTNATHVGMLGATCFFISGPELGFSAPGNPEHCPLSNRLKPGKDTSETIQTWLGFDRDCIMYTKNALYRLSTIGQSFEDSRFEEIESPVGLAGEWAAAALDGQQGHIFLAKSGLYLFDGTRVNEVSDPIEPLFTDSSVAGYIRPEHMGQAVMVTSRDRMLLAYRTTSGAGDNDRLLWGDFQDPANPAFTVIPWEITSMWREKADNYVMAGDSGGYLWVLDQGYTNDGAVIAWAVTTKEFRFSQQTMTLFDEVILDADFAGATTAVVVTTRGRGSIKTATYSSTASGRQRLAFKLPVYVKGETAQVAVSSSHAGKRSLYEVGFTSAAFKDEP